MEEQALDLASRLEKSTSPSEAAAVVEEVEAWLRGTVEQGGEGNAGAVLSKKAAKSLLQGVLRLSEMWPGNAELSEAVLEVG